MSVAVVKALHKLLLLLFYYFNSCLWFWLLGVWQRLETVYYRNQTLHILLRRITCHPHLEVMKSRFPSHPQSCLDVTRCRVKDWNGRDVVELRKSCIVFLASVFSIAISRTHISNSTLFCQRPHHFFLFFICRSWKSCLLVCLVSSHRCERHINRLISQYSMSLRLTSCMVIVRFWRPQFASVYTLLSTNQ